MPQGGSTEEPPSSLMESRKLQKQMTATTTEGGISDGVTMDSIMGEGALDVLAPASKITCYRVRKTHINGGSTELLRQLSALQAEVWFNRYECYNNDACATPSDQNVDEDDDDDDEGVTTPSDSSAVVVVGGGGGGSSSSPGSSASPESSGKGGGRITPQGGHAIAYDDDDDASSVPRRQSHRRSSQKSSSSASPYLQQQEEEEEDDAELNHRADEDRGRGSPTSKHQSSSTGGVRREKCRARNKDSAGHIKDSVFIGISRITSDECTRAVMKSTTRIPKLPKEKHALRLINATKGAYSWGSKVEVNAWLVTELEKRIHTYSWVTVLKTMLLIHRLIVDGSDTFLSVIQQYPDFFSPKKLKNSWDSDEEGGERQKTVLFFFLAYNHVIGRYKHHFYDFAVPFTSDPNGTTPDSLKWVDTLTLNDEQTIRFLHETIQVISLISSFQVKSAAFDNFVTVEVFRTILMDAKRLYLIVTKMMHISLINKQCKACCTVGISWYLQLFRSYNHVVAELRSMFLALKGTGVHFGESIPELQVLPEDFCEKLIRDLEGIRREKEEDHAITEVESLEDVLRRASTTNIGAEATTGASLSHPALDAPSSKMSPSSLRHQHKKGLPPKPPKAIPIYDVNRQEDDNVSKGVIQHEQKQNDNHKNSAINASSEANNDNNHHHHAESEGKKSSNPPDNRFVPSNMDSIMGELFIPPAVAAAGTRPTSSSPSAPSHIRHHPNQYQRGEVVGGSSEAGGVTPDSDRQSGKQHSDASPLRQSPPPVSLSSSVPSPSYWLDRLEESEDEDEDEDVRRREESTIASSSSTRNSDSGGAGSGDLVMVTSEPLVEGQTAKNRFTLLKDEILGKGGFGTVFKAWDNQEGRHVACKEIEIANKESLQSLFKEYSMLTSLRHPQIVRVIAFSVQKDVGHIFLEWVPSGSVQAVLQTTGSGLNESIIRRYMRHTLLGLNFLHKKGIIHRDIKPGNLLIDSCGDVKLTDFGTVKSSSDTSHKTNNIVGTVPYLAPECLKGFYGTASDVWSVGCTAVHLFTGHTPWSHLQMKDTISLIFHIGNLQSPMHIPKLTKTVEGGGEVSMSPQLQDFVMKCFTFDRKQRPSAEELLKHPFVADDDL